MTEWAPSWRVEVDWQRDGTWTDMSTVVVDDEEVGRVRSVDWQRGKNSDFGRYEAGTATVVLDNRDRALEPEYPDSDYWPNVRPMRPIRISATWDGGDVSVLTGVVMGWPPTWDQSGSEAHVAVEVADAFVVLAGARLASSVHVVEVRAAGPAAWWRLGEQSGTFAADSSGHGHHGTYENGAVSNTRTGLVEFDDDNAIEFPMGAVVSGANAGPYVVVPPVLTAYPFTVRATIQTTAEHNGNPRRIWGAVGVSGEYLSLGVLGDDWATVGTAEAGMLLAEVGSAGDLRARVATGIAVNDGSSHDIEWIVTDASTWEIKVDGVTRSEFSFASGSPAMPALTRAVIGASFEVAFLSGSEVETYTFDGIIDEVMVFDRAITAGESSTLIDARTTPWEGDTTGERIEKLLELAGITTHDIDPGGSQLQATGLGGRALEHIYEVADTEVAGLAGSAGFFITRDGVPRFRSRDAVYDDPRSNEVQAVFGDDWEGGDEIPYTVVEPTHGVATVVNSVEARRSGGSVFTVEDADSIGEHGTRSESLDLLVADDLEVQDAAGLLVAERSEAKLRFRKITVAPSIDPDNLWPVVLELDVGDRVSFRKRPPGGGDPVDVDAIIVGVAGRAPAGHCTIDFVLEPPPLDPFAWADDEDGSGPGLGWAEDDGTGGGAWVR